MKLSSSTSIFFFFILFQILLWNLHSFHSWLSWVKTCLWTSDFLSITPLDSPLVLFSLFLFLLNEWRKELESRENQRCIIRTSNSSRHTRFQRSLLMKESRVKTCLWTSDFLSITPLDSPLVLFSLFLFLLNEWRKELESRENQRCIIRTSNSSRHTRFQRSLLMKESRVKTCGMKAHEWRPKRQKWK